MEIKYVSLEGVLAKTGFTKNEKNLLLKTLHLYDVLYEKRSEAMGVGGVALRLYIEARYKAKIGNTAKITDVDLVFLEIPPWIKKYLQKDNFVPQERLFLNINGIVRKIVRTYEGLAPVWHLQPNLSEQIPIFDDVCFFEGKIGRIPILAEDFAFSSVVTIHTNYENKEKQTDIRIADKGLLLATFLNPDAITDVRARRSALLLASHPTEIESIAKRYVEVIKRTDIDLNELKKTLNILISNAKNQLKKYAHEFVEVVWGVLSSGHQNIFK
ncbi:MAG: hypothetical protein QW153_02385 [Candidatus Bilamarchaeaceae archaeon]